MCTVVIVLISQTKFSSTKSELRTAVSMKPATIVLNQKIFTVGGVYYPAGIKFYTLHCLAVTFQSNNR